MQIIRGPRAARSDRGAEAEGELAETHHGLHPDRADGRAGTERFQPRVRRSPELSADTRSGGRWSAMGFGEASGSGGNCPTASSARSARKSRSRDVELSAGAAASGRGQAHARGRHVCDIFIRRARGEKWPLLYEGRAAPYYRVLKEPRAESVGHTSHGCARLRSCAGGRQPSQARKAVGDGVSSS